MLVRTLLILLTVTESSHEELLAQQKTCLLLKFLTVTESSHEELLAQKGTCLSLVFLTVTESLHEELLGPTRDMLVTDVSDCE